MLRTAPIDERERRALALARDALDFDTAQARADFLDAQIGDDTLLRARTEALLERFGQADAAGGADAAQVPADALIGARLGPFRVLEAIGRGGMGVVYRGLREEADFEQEVALKLVRRGFDFDDVHARFLRERRILARLSHPNLARFIDGGVAPDGRPWFALEFVRGESILRWCDARRLGVRERVRLFREVCAAVQYAHSQLVVHRDLKPANVLVDAAGQVRLLDFGIARLLKGDGEPAATTMGRRYVLTPEYAPPEQFAGEDVGVAGDIYALGVILYQMVSGVLPQPLVRSDLAAAERMVRELPPQPVLSAITRTESGEQASAVAAARLAARSTSVRAYRSLVRGDLTRILDKALMKEPAQRYGTVEAFSDDLERWLVGAPVRISGNRFGYRLGKFVRRNRAAVAVVGLLTAGLLATTAWALRSAWLEHAQREVALAEVARADAVREYVMLMFRGAAVSHEGSELTARDVLERGADGIFERFRDEPRTGQTTALMLAELYSALDDAEGAAPLLERLLAWPGIEHNPAVLASARYLLADIRFQQGRLGETRELLDRAQAFWLQQPARYQEPLTRSRLIQGRLERGEGKLEASIRTLRDGIAARRRFRGGSDVEVGYALVSLSISLSRAQRQDEALDVANEACDTFAEIGMQHSSPGLAALGNRAMIAWNGEQRDSAVADLRRVTELRLRLYGPSTELAKVRSHLGEMLLRLGRLDEALPLLEGAERMAVEFGGDTGRVAVDTRRRLVQAYLAAKRPQEALVPAEAALAIARAESGEQSIEAGIGLALRARVRDALQDVTGADSDAAAASTIFQAHGPQGEAAQRDLDAWQAARER